MANLIQRYKKLNTAEKIGVWAIGGFIAYELTHLFGRNAQKETNKQIIVESTKELNDLNKKYTPTFKPSNYLAFANSIYEGTKYGIGDNYGAVRDLLMKMNNDLDVLLMVKAYGARQGYVFGIPQGEPKDLFTTIRNELGNEFFGLTSSKLDAINQNWKKKGIKYQI